MPINATFEASFAEWRMIMVAARHDPDYLAAVRRELNTEISNFLAFDDIERLDRIIRCLDYQMGEAQHKQVATLAD